MLMAIKPRENITKAWGTDSLSSAAKELNLTLLANSGIIIAMQRIHHHIGRQASKQA